ncbi:MAG: helix-turn-helix transcriptional regulator [Terracoccus sp.]
MLAQLTVPCLVLHRTYDMLIPVECGRYLAEHILGAVFVEQDSEDHMYWVGHQDQIHDAIRAILARTPGGQELGIQRRHRRQSDVGWESLTAAELDIAHLVAAGMTNRQIAERLTVSPRTVQTHVTHILAKLGRQRRSEIAVEATRRCG